MTKLKHYAKSRWLAILFSKSILLCLILLFVFLAPIWAQELRYSFRKGEMMEYELRNAPQDDEQAPVAKYRFIVDELEGDIYSMTLQMLGWFMGNSYSISNQTAQINSELRSPMTIIHKVMIWMNAEMNNAISFKINSKGKILEIRGYEKIQKDIFAGAKKNPGFKGILMYSDIEEYFSYQKYAYLISEFFPHIPNGNADSISFQSGKNRVTRLNHWENVANRMPDSQEFELRKSFKFNMDVERSKPHPTLPEDVTYDYIITWPRTLGFPVQLKYMGYSPVTFYAGNFNMENPSLMDVSPVEIINIYHTDSYLKPVQIAGELPWFSNQELTLALPGSGITKRIIKVNTDEEGLFQLDFEMDIKAGLVDIYQESQDDILLKLFVRPGDTLLFAGDLNHVNSIEYQGNLFKEQRVLNSVDLNPEESLREDLDPYFVTFLRRENQYTEYRRQIQWMRRGSTHTDSIRKYRKYLGDQEGYLSDSYKKFITSYAYTTFFRFGPKTESFLNFAPSLFIDWDLYWYRAYWTQEYMLNDLDQDAYLRFKELYPETPYQKDLESIYYRNQKWEVGREIPKSKLKCIDGTERNIKNLKGEHWGIFVADESIESNYQQFRSIQNFNHGQEYPIKIFVWSPDSLIREAYSKSDSTEFLTFLAGPEENEELAEFLEGYPNDFLFLGTKGRIVYRGFMYLGKVITWPPVEDEEGRTISLVIFAYSLAGVLVLSLGILLSIRIRSKRRETRINLKRRIAQLEVDAVRARMNPHFLFNALGSIQNLVNKGKNQEASIYLARFGELVRTILSQSSKSVIGLDEELELIQTYVQLEQLGFPFSFTLEIEPTVDPTVIEIPPLLLQPHLENAILHGISTLGDKGKLILAIRFENNHLICEIIDNGVGYKELQIENGGLGQGWKLTRQRIDLMKEQFGDDVSVEVSTGNKFTTAEYSGTTVTFRLPIQKGIQ